MPDTSSEKLVKNACKPKKGAPKAKYLDPIIASTQSQDGPISDICAALAPRLREPNVDVVFKALIVLHSMIRSGGTDYVLEYLSRFDVLRLKSVGVGGFWEGYSQTPTLTHYAAYLHARIHAFRTLKHDMVRVQAENNRASAYRTHTESVSQRARKLRSLTVEKGLLKETREVQKIISELIKAEFYRDDLQDECTVLAFRMMVKDLLVLFQAGNEGIVNLLEHYFEMSHTDASDALSLYKSFCSQTKRVVEYLKYARDLNNVIDVPVPNLKHAPVSLVAALEEYLQDPDFERNRAEYKESKDVADGKTPKKAAAPKQEKAPDVAPSSATTEPPTRSPKKTDQRIIDFFSSIEENQPTMFDPQTNSSSSAYFNQQAAFNPFNARLQHQQQQHMVTLPTGFPYQLPPQPTGFAAFGGGPAAFPPPSALGMPSVFVQPQQTGFVQQPQQTGFLQPQQTGFGLQSNPFRQSMLAPSSISPAPASASPFDFLSQQPSSLAPSNAFNAPQLQPLQSQQTGHHTTNPFARPASAPFTAQATGPGKNPFGTPSSTTQPQPVTPNTIGSGPSLNDLAFGTQPFGGNQAGGTQAQNGGANTGAGLMSSLASEFAVQRPASAGSKATSGLTSSSNSTSTSPFASLGLTSPQAPLQAQPTGFSGSSVAPFKPTSLFGASMLSSLPEVSPAAPGGGFTPNPFRQSTLPASFGGSTSFNPSSSLSTSSGQKPFPTPSASIATQPTSGQPNSGLPFASTSAAPLLPQATGLPPPFKPTSAFGQSLSAGGGGAAGDNPFGQASDQQQSGAGVAGAQNRPWGL